MTAIEIFGVPARPNDARRVLPQEYELYDDHGNCIGIIELARTGRVAGAGAETVYLTRPRTESSARGRD